MKLIHNASRRVLTLALILTIANAVNALRPDVLPHLYISLLNLLGGIVLALEGLLLCKRVHTLSNAEPASHPAGPLSATPSPAPRPPAASRDERSRHELAALLGIFQDKGRLVDFLMEDITSQPDARVGQVARIVHTGCREVLEKHFQLGHVTDTPEGSPCTLDAGQDRRSWRLIGSVTNEPPHKGTLLHAGWQTRTVTLPEITRDLPETSDHYLIAPAELELKS